MSAIEALERRATLLGEEPDSDKLQIITNLRRAKELDGPYEPRGSLNAWEEVLRAEVQDSTAVASTASETILVPNVTLPARYLVTGRALRATVRGRYGTTGTPTIIFRQRIGGLAGALAAASSTYTTPSGVTTVPFELVFDVVVRSYGRSTAGTVFTMGRFQLTTAAPNTLAQQLIPATAPAVSAGFDSEAAQDFAVTVQWGTSNASNTITAHQYILESLN